MDDAVRNYLAEIGRRGGRRSKRVLTSKASRDMLRVREARRAFRNYYSRCFWSFDPNYRITLDDVHWVAEGLRKFGDRQAWNKAARLCR